MSLRNLPSLGSQALDCVAPFVRFSVCRQVWYLLDLSTQSGVFESFFHRMFSYFECEHPVCEIVIASSVVDTP